MDKPQAGGAELRAESDATCRPWCCCRCRPPKLDTRANVANGVIVAGGPLTLGGIGCLVAARTTSQAAQGPAISYQQWGDLGSTGHALNAAGPGLTITGGAVLIGGTAWRIAIAKRAK